jgi:CHAT domain-containing protein
MYSPRSLGTAFALWLATVALACAQAATENRLDEKIRQADALQEKGALQEAQTAYETALEALPSDVPSPQLGHVLNGLSNVTSSLGKNNDAVDFAQQADKVYRKLGDAEGQAYALNSRGIAEGELGLYPTAQASFHEALTFSRSIHDFKTEVRTLNNLGNAYYFPGNYLEALRAYEEALQIVERHSTELWSDYWRQITKINQATLYQRLGRYQNALQIYKQVGTSSKSLPSSDQAHLFMNLGVLYRRLGDPWKALDSYQSALSQFSRQHDDDGEISVLKNMGIVYALDLSDFGKAQRLFERSLARAQETHSQLEAVQAHLYLGETSLRKSDLKYGRREFQEALALAQQLGTVEEQWKAHYGLGRIAELSAHPAEAEAEYRKAISIIETTRTQLQLSALRAEFLADKRDAYDALIALLLAGNDIKGAFSVLERSRARTFQDRLMSGPGGNMQPAVALGLDEVQGYLNGDTVLMEFWLSSNRLAIIWCTRQSYGVEQKQFSVEERESMLGFLRQLPDNLQADWRRQSAVLARLFPAASFLSSNLRHAFIVPDGWLSSVPFDLVPVSLHPDTLLIEKYDISYLPTAALLRRPSARQTGLRFPWMQEFIAFGRPSVAKPDRGQPTFENGGGMAALPYSAEEIQSISRMARGRSEVHLGAADVRGTFLAPKSLSAPILHVSTHAFADADIPENSRILFSADGDGSVPEYVFLRELYDLDLREVNLATISACNTERGKMIRGEGVQAFSRALLVAGSRSALTTLWRVADQPTSQFMKQFYYYALVQRQPKAEALRSAKLKFLHSQTELANPAHWAAFVIHGDGTGTLPHFISWGNLVAAVMIAISALAAGLWLMLRSRRRRYRVHTTQGVISE